MLRHGYVRHHNPLLLWLPQPQLTLRKVCIQTVTQKACPFDASSRCINSIVCAWHPLCTVGASFRAVAKHPSFPLQQSCVHVF